jgi:ribonuclease D
MRKTFKLAAQEVGNVAARHGWRDEVFGRNAIAMRKGELAIALEKGEAVIVDLEAEQ